MLKGFCDRVAGTLAMVHRGNPKESRRCFFVPRSASGWQPVLVKFRHGPSSMGVKWACTLWKLLYRCMDDSVSSFWAGLRVHCHSSTPSCIPYSPVWRSIGGKGLPMKKCLFTPKANHLCMFMIFSDQWTLISYGGVLKWGVPRKRCNLGWFVGTPILGRLNIWLQLKM